MDFRIFTLFLVIFCGVCKGDGELSSEDEAKIFEDYLRRFNIRRERTNRVEKMRENVVRRYKEVRDHNERFASGNSSFVEALNQFSWQSPEELAATSLGFRGNETSSYSDKGIRIQPVDAERSERTLLPSYWNWADQGIVRPVQNQYSCNACYAFAALGAIEAAACRKHGQCSKLSEQEAIECTAMCDGGWDDWVYQYSIANYGCTSAIYPYYGARVAECSAAKNRQRLRHTRVTGWHTLPSDAETIRHHLYEHGPMFMSFFVHENFFSYSTGVYSSTEGSKLLGGHAVLLTGYGSENGYDYWILRNSWGVDWGEAGYFRMLRGFNLCNCESWKVTFPLVE